VHAAARTPIAATPSRPAARAPQPRGNIPAEPPAAFGKTPAEPPAAFGGARPAAPPRQAPRAKTPAPAAAAPASAPSSSEASAMELASACLARGDNECVIRALEGNAGSERELGLLIETYRAIGDAKSAQKNMNMYLKRYPSARRAEVYRRMLELQSE
jgi:hypothetical protein